MNKSESARPSGTWRSWIDYLAKNEPIYAGDHSGGPWVNLLWLGFLLVPLMYAPWPDWRATLLGIAGFVPLHLWAFYRSGPTLWISRAAMFLIGALLFAHNSFAHTWFIYAGYPGARARPREALATLLAALLAAWLFLWWVHADGVYFLVMAIILLGSGFAVLTARVHRATLHLLAGKDQEIARLAKIAERERIARDLHDLLGHTLSAIAVKSDLASKLIDSNDRAAQEMRDVAATARSALQQVRRAIAGLHEMRLRDALAATQALLRAAGIEASCNVQPLPPMSPAQEQALGQVLMEAGTNIVRHANARVASISIGVDQSAIIMEVRDDGCGKEIEPGRGLSGMRERMQSLGGTLTIGGLSPGIVLTMRLPRDPTESMGGGIQQ